MCKTVITAGREREERRMASQIVPQLRERHKRITTSCVCAESEHLVSGGLAHRSDAVFWDKAWTWSVE